MASICADLLTFFTHSGCVRYEARRCSSQAMIAVSTSSDSISYSITCPDATATCPDAVPAASCPADCSGNGRCNWSSGECICQAGWHGEDCSDFSCPLDQQNASSADVVAEHLNTGPYGRPCECSSAFTGVDCSMPVLECTTDCALLVRSFTMLQICPIVSVNAP